MTILNPSFEEGSLTIGVPEDWDIEDNTAFVEVAEFGPSLGSEGFERDWRLPLGLNITEGDLSAQKIWASIVNGVSTIDPPPSADVVLNPVLNIVFGTIPVGGVVVTLGYTNEDGVAGRTSVLFIPQDSTTGIDYVFDLEDDDIGFEEITSLSTSIALPSTEFAVIGSWFLAPRNEAAIFEFDESPGVDTFPFNFNGNPFDGFEGGWNNDGGFRNNFNALLSDAADFDTATYEDFEDSWKLPKTPPASPYNEVNSFAHHNFVDGSAASSYKIVSTVNDKLSLLFEDDGTLATLNISLAAGTYTPSALASEMQNKIRTALDADGGDTVGTDFSTIALSTGAIRLINEFAVVGSERGHMKLLPPEFASAWEYLGITTGRKSRRADESETLEAASVNSEDFESDWRSNQDSVFSLPDDANGIIAAADFGGPSPNTPETFESGWVLTL